MRLIALCAVLASALALSGCGSSKPTARASRADITGSYARAGTGNEHFKGEHPNHHVIHGIDVSKYQGRIDWETVRDAGVKFAYIKATEGGNHTDSRFAENWEGAAAAGIPRGAYHFVYWCRPWREEMAWFKRVVPVDPDALPPVLDVEATPTSKTCKRTLYREEVLREMRLMLEDMERHYGKRPVIYVTVDFYEHIMHPDEFKDYKVWVRSTKYAPHVKYPGRKWAFWQYQSDARIPGIRGNVDRNAFKGSHQDWARFVNNTVQEDGQETAHATADAEESD
jgi:lysozyme